MVAVFALLCLPRAFAGDEELYQRALDLIDDRYLWRDRIDHAAMFRAAAAQASERLDWLVVEDTAEGLRLRAGPGHWSANVAYTGELVHDLGVLEDTIRGAGEPIDADVDLRAELLKGAVATLDRHTVVLYASSLDKFDERLNGTLSGIGVTLRDSDEGLVVDEVFPHGPADDADLRPGDRLLRIDGISVMGMHTDDATDRIRGAAGTPVVLGLRRGDAELDVRLVRRELSIPNARASVGPDGVGVVAIDHFSEQTSEWLQASLDELANQGALTAGVVVDLRDNTGGSLVQSARAADAFVQRGRLVVTSGRDGGRVPGLVHEIDARADYPPYDMPVVVLTNPSTASGSEILAGALTQLDRAVLVGERSFGKGTVQSLYVLDDGVKLKLTVAEYVLAGERHVNGVGLTPDVYVEPWRFGRSGAWYPAPAPEASPWVVPGIAESTGWRDGPPAERPDLAMDLAARIAHAAEGDDRAGLLAAAARVVPAVGAAAEADLVATFAAGGLDWHVGPAPTSPPLVEVHVAPAAPARAGEEVELHATVVNHGPELWRAAVRVESVDPLWQDLVFPIGHLPAGGTTTAIARVVPDADAPARSEEVALSLEADGVAPLRLPSQLLEVSGGADPAVAVELRVVGAGPDAKVVVDVANRGDAPLGRVRVTLRYPDVDGVSLDDDHPVWLDLTGRRGARAEVGIDVGPAFTGRELPLAVDLRDDVYGALGRYSALVGLDGTAAHVEPPTVGIRDLPTRTSASTVTFRVRAADDTAVDHVLVFAGDEDLDRTRREAAIVWHRKKVAWIAGGGRRLDETVTVPIAPGENHLRLVAVDRDGQRTSRDLYVWGAPAPAATVDEGG